MNTSPTPKWPASAAWLAIGLLTSAAQATVVAPSVHTDAGWVEGASRGDALDFWGIPFAAPPVGDLRWKAPAPVAPWPGVRAALVPGPACTQDGRRVPSGVPNSSEDCLYLNVHVPPGLSDTAAAPVMVWVPGGAWINGAGAQYDGSKLAQASQSVVVTINYRLGLFGSLALNSLLAEGHGNAGLMDQQAALRWVQRNIARFGGNPQNVTLFGQSAGSASVCQQLVSPGAAGLFHRAIMQSGPCTFGTTAKAEALKNGQAFVTKLACPDSLGASAQLACLRSKTAAEVFAASPTLNITTPGSLGSLTPFQDGIVLPAMPRKLIEQGKFNRVPVVIGNTKDEGTLFIALAYDIARGHAMTDDELKSLLAGLTQGNSIATSLLSSYYTTRKYGTPGQAASALVTDAVFACGAQWSARQLAGRVATYAYQFDEQRMPALVNDPFMAWGAYHAAELPLVFQTEIATVPPSGAPADVLTPAQLKLSDAMMGYWGRFAATGNPNGAGAVAWPRFSWPTHGTLHLDSAAITSASGSSVTGPHNCSLWDTLASLGVGL
ncbi:MAG: hypothetical protein RI907_3727 [Pseudomonadota bacterium]|jgi:para-nitrobenzyl esterase